MPITLDMPPFDMLPRAAMLLLFFTIIRHADFATLRQMLPLYCLRCAATPPPRRCLRPAADYLRYAPLRLRFIDAYAMLLIIIFAEPWPRLRVFC